MEIEKRYKIDADKKTEIIRILQSMDFQNTKTIHQVDTYFLKSEQPENKRNFIASNNELGYLRIRNNNDKKFLFTLKTFDRVGRDNCANEIEGQFDSVDSYNKMLDVFLLSGFIKGVVIDKTRESYRSESRKNINIEFDNVVGLGDYIEIEIIGDYDTCELNLSIIDDFAKSLGLSDITPEPYGYVDLLWDKWEQKQ